MKMQTKEEKNYINELKKQYPFLSDKVYGLMWDIEQSHRTIHNQREELRTLEAKMKYYRDREFVPELDKIAKSISEKEVAKRTTDIVEHFKKKEAEFKQKEADFNVSVFLLNNELAFYKKFYYENGGI